jgi:microcystin-dependent protein
VVQSFVDLQKHGSFSAAIEAAVTEHANSRVLHPRSGNTAQRPDPNDEGALYADHEAKRLQIFRGTAYENIAVGRYDQLEDIPDTFSPESHRTSHYAGAGDVIPASEMEFTPGTNVASNRVRAAILEVAQIIVDHLADTTAHQGTEIEFDPSGTGLTDTNLEDALVAHITGLTSRHQASQIAYAGSSGLPASSVETAVDTLQSQKAATSALHARGHGFASQTDHTDLRNTAADAQTIVRRNAGPDGAGFYWENVGAVAVPNASEGEAGKAEIADATEAVAMTDNARIMSPLKTKLALYRHLPAGAIIEYHGIRTPIGYLRALGQAVARATYPDLFANSHVAEVGNTVNSSNVVTNIPDLTDVVPGMIVEGAGIPLGTIVLTVDSASQITLSNLATTTATGMALRFFVHGQGDGSLTFNIVDMRGRSAMGDGQGLAIAGLTMANRRVGQWVGEEKHLQTVDEMVGHNHGGATGSGGSHNHTFEYAQNNNSTGGGSGDRVSNMNGGNTKATSFSGNHAHSVPAQGGGQPFNVVHPAVVVPFLVKT